MDFAVAMGTVVCALAGAGISPTIKPSELARLHATHTLAAGDNAASTLYAVRRGIIVGDSRAVGFVFVLAFEPAPRATDCAYLAE